MNRAMIAAFFAFTTFACSHDDSGSDASPDLNGGNKQEKTSYEINGVSAEAYYNKFIYSDSGEGIDKYSFVISDFEKIGDLANDHDDRKCGSFKLFMLSDKNFTMDYKETFCVWSSVRPETRKDVFSKRLSGTWKVEGMNLLIGDLAVGSGLNFNERDIISLKFKNSIHDTKLEDATFEGYYRKSDKGL